MNQTTTLIKWLEDNRSKLKDGIYSVDIFEGCVLRDGNVFAMPVHTNNDTSKYAVKDGDIFELRSDDWWTDGKSLTKSDCNVEPKNKYNRQCKGVTIDVYDVLKAFEVTDPALQHLIKKALCAGLRGFKSLEQDLLDILESSNRALELYHDDNGSTEGSPEVPGVRGCDDNPEAVKKNINDIIDRNRDYKLP